MSRLQKTVPFAVAMLDLALLLHAGQRSIDILWLSPGQLL